MIFDPKSVLCYLMGVKGGAGRENISPPLSFVLWRFSQIVLIGADAAIGFTRNKVSLGSTTQAVITLFI
jgi:hypothetical protein